MKVVYQGQEVETEQRLLAIDENVRKTGFFVFPKYQVWNEFLLQHWARRLMIFAAYVIELLLIFLWIPRFIRKLKD